MLSCMRSETYALTAVAHQRRRILQATSNAELLVSTLFRYRDRSRFLLHGFAVMPEHVHVLLTPAETIERTVQLIKGGYSFAVRKQFAGEVWQPGYHAHRITSADDYRNQLAYIAANPDARRLRDYPYVHTRYAERLDPPPCHWR
jgi:putative transposase